jgi:hypothetical protein
MVVAWQNIIEECYGFEVSTEAKNHTVVFWIIRPVVW